MVSRKGGAHALKGSKLRPFIITFAQAEGEDTISTRRYEPAADRAHVHGTGNEECDAEHTELEHPERRLAVP